MPAWATTLLCLMLLTGCGEIAIKRGAGPDDLKADQEKCRIAGGDLDACMNARGWTIHRPGAASADLYGPENPVPAQMPATQEKKDDAALVLSVEPTRDNRDPTPVAKPKPPAKPYDPMASHSISSWWKRGGNGDDLKAAADACTAKLGEAHRLVTRPEGGNYATGALLHCLREAGWYAVGNPS